MIKTDILIIGAGPTGLFTVFEAGLLKLKCHLIDALPQPGGQCSEIYPKKPIYDIPGFPEILAGDLTGNLLEQGKQFEPGFTLGERAETIEKLEDGTFIVTTNKGTKHHAPIVAIAGGLGSFEPRKPKLENLDRYEDNGLAYFIKDPEIYRNKRVVIAGGGDSELRGEDKLESIVVEKDGEKTVLETDEFLPLFGLSPKLGPIANWGLEIEKNAIKVDNALDYQTNIPGVFAIGDVNTYPGKLKLILCGFHEATLMCQAAYKIINPGKKFVLKYTTVSGIDGFDGTRKEAPKAVVKAIQ